MFRPPMFRSRVHVSFEDSGEQKGHFIKNTILGIICILIVFYFAHSIYYNWTWLPNSEVFVQPNKFSSYIYGIPSLKTLPSLSLTALNLAAINLIKGEPNSSLNKLDISETSDISTPIYQDNNPFIDLNSNEFMVSSSPSSFDSISTNTRFKVSVLLLAQSSGFSPYTPIVYHPLLAVIASIYETCDPNHHLELIIGFDYEDPIFDFDERRKEFLVYVDAIITDSVPFWTFLKPSNKKCDMYVSWVPFMATINDSDRFNILARHAYANHTDFFVFAPAYPLLEEKWIQPMIDTLRSTPKGSNFYHPTIMKPTSLNIFKLNSNNSNTSSSTVSLNREKYNPSLFDVSGRPTTFPSSQDDVWPYLGIVCADSTYSNNNSQGSLTHRPHFCMVSRLHLELHQGSLFPFSSSSLGTAIFSLLSLYVPFNAVRSTSLIFQSGYPSVSCAVPIYTYLVDPRFVLSVKCPLDSTPSSSIQPADPCFTFTTRLLAFTRPWLFSFDNHYLPTCLSSPLAPEGKVKRGSHQTIVSSSSSIVGPFESSYLSFAGSRDVFDSDTQRLLFSARVLTGKVEIEPSLIERIVVYRHNILYQLKETFNNELDKSNLSDKWRVYLPKDHDLDYVNTCLFLPNAC